MEKSIVEELAKTMYEAHTQLRDDAFKEFASAHIMTKHRWRETARVALRCVALFNLQESDRVAPKIEHEGHEWLTITDNPHMEGTYYICKTCQDAGLDVAYHGNNKPF